MTEAQVRAEFEIVKTNMEKVKMERPGFQYEIIDLFEVLPTMTSKNAKIVRVVDESIQQVLNKRPEYVISPGTYDQISQSKE